MARTACMVIAALALTAGCAGSDNGRLSKSEYEANLRAAFGAAAEQLRPDRGVTGSPELVARIAGAYGGIASRLRRVRPPADVQALNARLVAGAAREAA